MTELERSFIAPRYVRLPVRVKSVLSAPVPEYCTLTMSALSAHTPLNSRSNSSCWSTVCDARRMANLWRNTRGKMIAWLNKYINILQILLHRDLLFVYPRNLFFFKLAFFNQGNFWLRSIVKCTIFLRRNSKNSQMGHKVVFINAESLTIVRSVFNTTLPLPKLHGRIKHLEFSVLLLNHASTLIKA